MYCSTTYIITHHGVLWRLFIVDLIVIYLDSLAVGCSSDPARGF